MKTKIRYRKQAFQAAEQAGEKWSDSQTENSTKIEELRRAVVDNGSLEFVGAVPSNFRQWKVPSEQGTSIARSSESDMCPTPPRNAVSRIVENGPPWGQSLSDTADRSNTEGTVGVRPENLDICMEVRQREKVARVVIKH